MLFTCFLKLGSQRNEGFSSSLTVNKLVTISSPKKVIQFSSVAQSCLTLQPNGLQHARPPCPSQTPGVYSNSRPLSW